MFPQEIFIDSEMASGVFSCTLTSSELKIWLYFAMVTQFSRGEGETLSRGGASAPSCPPPPNEALTIEVIVQVWVEVLPTAQNIHYTLHHSS